MPGRGPVKDRSEVPETKRKVILAALRAGVKPTQVAKHFGVSPAALRQIGSAGE
jgi:transposase-like protein